MNEAEALTKWCPFVRLAAPVDSEASGTAGNRFGDDVGNNFCCIASACMAWRTVKFDATADKIAAIKEHRRIHDSDLLTAKNAVEAQWSGGIPHGYCGLAGVQ